MPGCSAGAGKLTAASELPRRPNFVFFLIDDMGWRDVGCYGSKFHETPDIDRLARQDDPATQGRDALATTTALHD